MDLANKADLPNSQIDNGNFALYNTLLALGSSRTVPQEAQFQALRNTLLLYLWTAQDYNAIVAKFTNVENNILSEVQQELLLLRSTIERSTAGQQFSNLTGYGGASIFDSLTNDESLDFPNTTATINATAQTCTWDSTGNQILAMADVVRANNFNSITLRMYNDELKKATVETVTDTTNIITSTNGYTLTTSDKLIHDNSEVGINSVTGGTSQVVYANEITTSDNNASGKNAVLFNGLRHVVVSKSTGLELWRIDSATSETKVADISPDVTTIFSVDVATVSSNEYIYITWGTTTQQKIIGYNTSYVAVQAELVHDTVTSFKNVDLSSDSNKLLVVNISKTASIPNDFNPREATYTIGTNGSLTIDYAVIQLVNGNASFALDGRARCGFVNGVQCVVNVLRNSTTVFATLYLRNSTLDPNATIDPNWTGRAIFNEVGSIGDIFMIVKSNGNNLNRIVVVTTVSGTLKFAYSDDLGLTYITSNVGTGSNPQLTENLAGDIHITYENAGAIKTQVIPNGSDVPNIDGYVLAYDFTQDATVSAIEDRVGPYDTTSTGLTKVAGGFQGSANAILTTGLKIGSIGGGIDFSFAFSRSGNPSVTEILVDERNGSIITGQYGWYVRINPDGNFIVTYNGLTGDSINEIFTGLQDGNIHTVRVQWDGTLGTDACIITIDGTPRLATSTSLWSASPFGITLFNKSSGGSGGFQGTIRDFTISLGTANNTNPLPTTKYVDTLVTSGASNPKTYGRSSDYIKPVASYDSGTSVRLAGEETIGTGFNIELSSPITVSPNDELTISTQFQPKQSVSNIPFKSEGFRYIEYQLTGLDVNTTDITIGNTANNVVSNLVSWNAI